MNYYKDALRKYAVFSGRASRREFWMFVLFSFVISIVLSIIDSMFDMKILNPLYSLAVLIPSLAVTVRRLHDTGRNGWWILIGLIPLIGWLVLVIFCAVESKADGMTPSASPTVPPAPMNPNPTM